MPETMCKGMSGGHNYERDGSKFTCTNCGRVTEYDDKTKTWRAIK